MAEFTAEVKHSRRPVVAWIAIAIVAVAAASVLLVARYQQTHRPKGVTGPVVVPGMVRPGDVGFEAYKNKVRIENVKASMFLNFAGNRVASIDGIIANEGSRKLEALELRITLYDVYDKMFRERIATPLRPGLGLFKGPMEPLEKRTFTVWIESIEQLWNPKRVEIEISGLKYQ
jgi:hypothetical protein